MIKGLDYGKALRVLSEEVVRRGYKADDLEITHAELLDEMLHIDMSLRQKNAAEVIHITIDANDCK